MEFLDIQNLFLKYHRVPLTILLQDVWYEYPFASFDFDASGRIFFLSGLTVGNQAVTIRTGLFLFDDDTCDASRIHGFIDDQPGVETAQGAIDVSGIKRCYIDMFLMMGFCCVSSERHPILFPSRQIHRVDSQKGGVMVYWRQLKSLLIHKWYVFLAGRMVGVPLWRLIVHDWSKFTPTEFFRYARYKYGNGTNEEWATGWLHHLHHNPHHPEHHILSWHGNPDFYSGFIGKDITEYVTVLPMPELFVREMVADMHATSKQITGSWDISKWLNSNGPKMHLNDDTITLIDKVMKEIGYLLTDNCDWSWIVGQQFRKWSGEGR